MEVYAMTVRLSSKGQLVIPKELREALGLQPGTQFDVELREGKIILEPIVPSAVEALYGKYAGVDFLAELEAEHEQEIQDEEALRT
jgi:antitoxin PrlF